MKNKILLLVFLFVQISYGQKNQLKLTYEVTARQGKNKNPVKDVFYLLIKNNKSLFISKNKVIHDSLTSLYYQKKKANSNDGHLFINGNDPLMIKAKLFKNKYKILVEKDFLSQKLKYQQTAFMSALQYTQKLPFFNWILVSETKTSMGYLLKKALLTYKGRQYTAWYAPSVPVSDGPYKFYGLPGLIFEISDAQQDYIFKLIGIENKNLHFPKRTFLENSSFFPVIQTSAEKFNKDFFKTFNPANIMGNVAVIGEDAEEYKRKRVEKMKSLYNNPIEIDEK